MEAMLFPPHTHTHTILDTRTHKSGHSVCKEGQTEPRAMSH